MRVTLKFNLTFNIYEPNSKIQLELLKFNMWIIYPNVKVWPLKFSLQICNQKWDLQNLTSKSLPLNWIIWLRPLK